MMKSANGACPATAGVAGAPLHNRANKNARPAILNSKRNLLENDISAVPRGHDPMNDDTLGHDKLSANDRGGHGGTADDGIGADDDVVFADKGPEDGAAGTDDDAFCGNHTARYADVLLQAQKVMRFYAAAYDASRKNLG